MTVLAQPLPPQAAYTDEPIFRLTVDQYHELVRQGKLTADDPVELLEGILLYKTPKNPPHPTATRLCRRAIEPLLPHGWFYDSQEPITLSDGEPEPDGIIVCGRIEDYLERHPRANDLGLVIEVSDTTIDRDEGIKLRSYARAGIAIYWIVNLNNRVLDVYTEPQSQNPEPSYAGHARMTLQQKVALTLDGNAIAEISVSALFPPPGGQP